MFATLVSDVNRVEKLLDKDYVYLDVRTEAEFAAGHLPSAVNVPILYTSTEGMTMNQDFTKTVVERFPDKDTHIIVGCKTGKRSELAYGLLQTEGYIHLIDFKGGYDAWVAAGLPTTA
jgi:rhodanese-related sulfurtransferase